MAIETAVDGTKMAKRAALLAPRHAFSLCRLPHSPAPSCRRGRCPQPGNQRQDVGEHLSRHRDFGHLEDHVASVAHYPRADLDQLLAQAGQRPRLRRLRHRQRPHETGASWLTIAASCGECGFNPPSSKVELSIPGPSIAYPMERAQNQKRSLGNALSILISCLLFGRETHASTTQSDPLLLPTRNGPCREDGALHWEYLF